MLIRINAIDSQFLILSELTHMIQSNRMRSVEIVFVLADSRRRRECHSCESALIWGCLFIVKRLQLL